MILAPWHARLPRRRSLLSSVKAMIATGSLLLASCGGGASGASEPASATIAPPATVTPPTAPPVAAASPTLTLRAFASGYGNSPAQVQVRSNGVVVATLDVHATTATDHTLVLAAALQPGTLEVVVLNADAALGRALVVQSLNHGGTTFTPTDNDVAFDQGTGPAAFDGLETVPGTRTLTTAGALRFTLPVSRVVAAAAGGVLDGGATAPGVYVDADRGDDANAGTVDRPWRSLTRLATVRLASGAGIYLRCGGVWRAELVLGAQQLAGNNVVAGYGAECGTQKATLSGADDYSGGWRLSRAVWSRALPAGTPKITQLFVDGQALRVAQWPDPTAAGVRRMALAATSAAASTLALQTTDATQLTAKDLAGATAQLRTQPWLIETRRITAARGATLDLDRAPQWPLPAGAGFVLQDKLWMLDSPGEFFHDTVTQQIHLIAPAAGAPADINSALVEGSVRDRALSLAQTHGLIVRDLALRAARQEGLLLTNTPQAQLSRLDARDNGSAGIRLSQWEALPANTPGPEITDSRVAGNGEYGIDALHVARARIQRVMALANGSAAQHQGGVAGAIAAGPGAQIEDNVVDGAGYIGIRFSALGGSVVARNTVSGYCRRLSDCGAIYTWTGRDAAAVAIATSTGGLASTVQGNRVLPAQAQLEGAVADGRDVVAGIYIDDHSHQAQVLDNVVVGAPVGVFVHNASGVRVSGNRIWQPTAVGLWVSMDERDLDSMVGNRFSDNTVVPLLQAEIVAGSLPALASSQAVWFWHAMSGEAALAPARNHFSGNRVLQLQGALAVHARVRGPAGERALDAEEWRAVNPAELAPQRPLLYTALATTLGDELVADGGFDRGLAAWRTYRNPASASFAAHALPSAQGCTGACISFTAGDPGDLLASRPFVLRPGAVYAYRLRATFAQSGSIAPPYISRDSTPWDSMADARGYVSSGPLHGAAGEMLAYEAFFSARAADASRVNLQLRSYGSAVALDAVSVREVIGWTATRSSDWSALAYARPDAARAVDCIELGWPASCTALGLDGQPVPLPLQLAAGTERLLLRGDSPFRR